jgi:hypothetical protein
VDAEQDELFDEIRHILQPFIDGLWNVAGDFNKVRSGEDRSTGTAAFPV